VTRITLQDGKIVLRDGKIGTEQACCCDLPECCEYCEGTATVYGQEVEISDAPGFYTLVCVQKVDPPQLLFDTGNPNFDLYLFFSYAAARAWYDCDPETGKLFVVVQISSYGIFAGLDGFPYSAQDFQDFAEAYDAAVLGSQHEFPGLIEIESEGPYSALQYNLAFNAPQRVFTSLGRPGFECIEGLLTEDETESTYANDFDFDSFPCLTENALSTKTDLNVNVTCSNNPLP
jgi:hypothetical protein